MRLLRRLHIAIYAWFVHYYRKRDILRVFKVAHAQELANLELQYWPLVTRSQGKELADVKHALQTQITAVEYKQFQEVAAIRAGKMDVTDRKSWAWPFLPSSAQRLAVPIAKSTPYNLRRMSRSPVPRRAMNMIKNAVTAQPWAVRAIDSVHVKDKNEQKERIKIANKMFAHPNNVDSFQSWLEMGLEDMLVLGAFPAELRFTPDPERPLKSWCVNVESIRIFASWSESLPDMPHYAQMTGLKGERGAQIFYDDELMYIKDNPSTDNPFGLGAMEVGFMSIGGFLGIQDMSCRAGSDQVHKTWLWWEQPQADSSYQIVRRHIQNELEGQAKVSIIGGMKKPDVLEINPVTEDDLLLNWQELLIRMIANAFDMSAMSLGVEHDVNRAVGQILDDKDFRSAVVPRAKRIQEGLTRKILHDKLQWYDLEFVFLNLDDPDAETKMALASQMYGTNSITPNEIRKKMGMEPLKSSYADLTQFEAMLVNMESQSKVQEGMQTRMMQKTSDMQQQQMFNQPPQPPQHQLEPGPQQPQQSPMQPKLTPQTMAKEGQPPAPKPLKLPQFHLPGTGMAASELVKLPVKKLARVLANSGKKPSQLLTEMANQDPSILEEMSDEVEEYFKEQLDEEAKRKKSKLTTGMLRLWKKAQAKRVSQDNRRIGDFATWLMKYGQRQGKPGGGSAKGGIIDKRQKTPSGKPGNIEPIKLG